MSKSGRHPEAARLVVSEEDASPTSVSGGATVLQTAVNVTKICIGTGALALPAAAEAGGLALAVLLLLWMGAWNMWACDRLAFLRRATREHTYSEVAGRALGSRWAAVAVNVFSILTFTGVCILYQVTFAMLLSKTPLALGARISSSTTTGGWKETLLSGLILLPLVVLPDLSFLSLFSALGIVALLTGFTVIYAFGLSTFDGGQCDVAMPWWPTDAAAFSRLYGTAAFCYGITPLIFSVQNSMAQPSLILDALRVALVFTLLAYVVVGVGVAAVFRCDPDGIAENILQNLPEHSFVATAVRLCYAVVCITSAPLTLVPDADMIASLSTSLCPPRGRSRQHLPINDAADDPKQPTLGRPMLLLRVGLVGLTTSIAVLLPQFGDVVAILGSVTVSTLSFSLPSLMYIVARWRELSWRAMLPDVVLVLAGGATGVLTTVMTVRDIAARE